jgi:hypothetical protein
MLRRKRVEALEAQYQPQADHRWYPWKAGDREAWAKVSEGEKARLQAQYHRAGGLNQPIMVARAPDGTWYLTTFNLPLGGVLYVVRPALEALGPQGMSEWAGEHCSLEEVQALVRLVQGGWGPTYLHDGDVDLLGGLVSRFPRTHP